MEVKRLKDAKSALQAAKSNPQPGVDLTQDIQATIDAHDQKLRALMAQKVSGKPRGGEPPRKRTRVGPPVAEPTATIIPTAAPPGLEPPSGIEPARKRRMIDDKQPSP